MTKMLFSLNNYGKDAAALIGGKGANIGEMLKIGIPTPDGFVIGHNAYKLFEKESSIVKKIEPYIKNLLSASEEKWEQITQTIRQIIISQKMPEELQKAVCQAYKKLSLDYGCNSIHVAVRSSGIDEDSSRLSFAGQFDSILNVIGDQGIIKAVKDCWASNYTSRCLIYRKTRGLDIHGGGMCVIVQKMIVARSAGVCFTIDPVSGSANNIVMESNWGVGESIAQGLVDPDRFVVNKKSLKIVERNIGEKKTCIKVMKSGTKQCSVPIEKRLLPSLQDKEIKKVAFFAKTLEEHYNCPQDVEWVVDQNAPYPHNIFILQTRAVTRLTPKEIK